MLIGRFRTTGGPWLGVVEGDVVRRVAATFDSEDQLGVAALMASGWRDGEPIRLGPELALADAFPLAPIPKPGKIIGVGLNYRDHAAESKLEEPEYPEIFAKFANSVIGPGAAIEIPPADASVDYEAELAVVMGRRCRYLKPAEALDAVAGFTVANDVSARTLQHRVSQWVTGKACDSFLPIGPWLRTPDGFDANNARVGTRLNGRLVQDANTADMIFDTVTLLTYLSTVMTLEPGDVVLTGTPSGVGHSQKPPRYLELGDQVAVFVEGIGELTNGVRHGVAGSG